jgi:hypothetical protein
MTAEPPDGSAILAVVAADAAAHLDIPAAALEKAYRVVVASLWWRWWCMVRTRADNASALEELIGGPTRTIHVIAKPTAEMENAAHDC